MKVRNMESSNGNKIANQFVIDCGDFELFQSYDTIIVKKYFLLANNGYDLRLVVELDKDYWNYSKTTSKYRSMFLGESTKETQEKIDSGEYILTDLKGRELWLL